MTGTFLRRMHLLAVAGALALAGCAPEYAKSGYAAASGPANPRARAAPAPRTQIPLPKQAQLAPEPEPTCGSTAADLGGQSPTWRPKRVPAQLASLGAGQSPNGAVLADAPPLSPAASAGPPLLFAQSGPDENLVLLTKLALEVECYRRAESGVRKRLHELQASVRETIEAINGQATIAP
jgi:hypothetical protein